jgi:hypothetical protein
MGPIYCINIVLHKENSDRLPVCLFARLLSIRDYMTNDWI